MFNSTIDSHRKHVEQLFERQDVASLSDLRRTLGVRSRTTVFFALKAAGYCTSYSHAGRFYALRRIPKFDPHGLWFSGDVRFSIHGTLRTTIVVLVCQAPAGRTHEELEGVLGLRVHDTLRSLIEAHALRREQVLSVYVYLDPDAKRATAQIKQRRGMMPSGAPDAVRNAPVVLDAARVIDVLVAVIRAPRSTTHAIARRLRAGGSNVTDDLVKSVFARYALGKKTVRSPSRRSRH